MCTVVRYSLCEFVLTADLLERAEFMQRKLIELTDAADDAARERELAAEIAAAVVWPSLVYPHALHP